MGDVLRLILMVLAGGLAVTLGVAAFAWLMAEERRLARVFRRALGAAPDAAIVARGTGRGAALSMAARRIVTAWDGGGWRMDYALDELLGAEIDIDGEVAARAMRGEPRRLLERTGRAEHEVRLRLLFDDPRHPDFELALWPGRGAPANPREAIAEANRWVARVEAVLRRTGGPLVKSELVRDVARPRSVARTAPTPDDTLDLFEDEDELEAEEEDDLPF
ncbi:MAG TPA: hypothetical protein VGL58_08300 [Caulobacteraceae bacterium]|jgi:hypothetical protein